MANERIFTKICYFCEIIGFLIKRAIGGDNVTEAIKVSYSKTFEFVW